MSITNALTVDVEDYFHVSAFEKAIDRAQWDALPLRVGDNTKHLLDLFDDYNVKGTFFVLGWVAERLPSLIVEISSRGHEVACHGYSHRLIYDQTPEEFREETLAAKRLLEDIVQKPVIGYRAASYSITKDSLWATDILAEAGFIYDSSIFPVRHDRYGIPGAVEYPHRFQTPEGNTLVEFPLSTAKVMGYTLPVSGGGYFRLYPYSLTRLGLSRVNKHRYPFIFYLHPWEIDQEQPRVSASWLSRFRHYNNIRRCHSRLKILLEDFRFDTVFQVLSNAGLMDSKSCVSTNPGKASA